jgi:glycosyltransferase involved in cell wall biosynthesis
MRFSVIIPTWNRSEMLMQTLASVRAQSMTDHEVIVVDDGSTDGTLEQLASRHTEAKVLQHQNRGPGAARNLGARHAKGDYLAFLDSDDVWFPWTLATYAEALSRANEPSFLAGKPLRFRNNTELPEAPEAPTTFATFPDYLASGDEWRWWGASSFVIRRDAMMAGGGFAEENMNGEDADLALKLGTARGFVQVTNPVTFGYREHAANVTVNIGKTITGLWHKIRAESSGGYPGGEARAPERWRILTRHARPVILRCLQNGQRAEAWRMYRATFRWHAALGKWKFLFAFPWLSLTHGFRAGHATPQTA